MAETRTEEQQKPHAAPEHGGTAHAHPPAQKGKKKSEKKSPVRAALPFLFAAILIAGAIYGWHIVQFNKVHEDTDDAQIDVDISPIIPRVSGYVKAIYVNDNDTVDSNAVLVTLDASDLALKVSSAEAAVANAEAAVKTTEASATAAHANEANAEVNRTKTTEDLERDRGLLAGGAMTKEQFDAANAAAESAGEQVKSTTDQAGAAESQIVSAEAQVKSKQVDLDNAKLQLSYATIASPVAGTVAKRNVELGEYIQSGQPLMAIAQRDIWITANFKETQLFDVKPGQRVDFTVDAYPDSTFHGTVQSISPATGAKFSLLPPDNSTGNFVKVTQRVPVKILVDRRDYSKSPLRPGMSVDAIISTGK